MLCWFYVPKVLCSHSHMFPVTLVCTVEVLYFLGPMFSRSYILRVLYSQGPIPHSPMFSWTYVLIDICSHGPVFSLVYVLMVLCSHRRMFSWSYVLIDLCSHGPMFSWSFILRVLYSQGPIPHSPLYVSKCNILLALTNPTTLILELGNIGRWESTHVELGNMRPT